MVSVFTQPDVNTWEVGRTLDKLETTPLCVVVFYAYLVFSQPSTETILHFFNMSDLSLNRAVMTHTDNPQI